MYTNAYHGGVCTLVKKGKGKKKEIKKGDFNKIFLTLVNNKCSSVYYMNAEEREMDHKICTLDCF